MELYRAHINDLQRRSEKSGNNLPGPKYVWCSRGMLGQPSDWPAHQVLPHHPQTPPTLHARTIRNHQVRTAKHNINPRHPQIIMASPSLPTNVHVSNHPCLRAKLSRLRSQHATARETKALIHEIALIVGCQALERALDTTSSGTVRDYIPGLLRSCRLAFS